jgi:hypothetical protein
MEKGIFKIDLTSGEDIKHSIPKLNTDNTGCGKTLCPNFMR